MANKLDNDQRMFVLRMHAEGISAREIVKEIKSKWDISICHQAIHETCRAKKHEPHVKAFKEAYLAKVKSVPIANKRIRIDDLERERKRLNRLIQETPKNSRADKTLYLSLVAELRRITEVAREEMEKKPHLFQNVNVAMGELSDESIEQRRQELIGKIRRSIGGGTTRTSPDPAGEGEEIT